MAYKLLVQTNPFQGDDSFFSIDGGKTWSAYISQSFETQTTVTLQVKSSAPGEGTTTWYFWGWTDKHKGFDRKVVVNDVIQLVANISTSPKPVNKIVLGGSDQTEKQRVLLDLSSDTLSTADQLPQNITAHNNKGEKLTGTAHTYSASETTIIDSLIEETVADGPSYIESGVTLSAQVDSTNIESDNIKSGVAILGVQGSSTVVEVKNDTLASADQLLKDVKAHDKTGAPITGTLEFPTEYPESGSFVGNTATSYIIDPSITALASYAFYNKNTTTIQNLSQITQIGEYCFDSCKLSGEITMNNLQSIAGGQAFYACTGITKFSSDSLLRFGTATAGPYASTFSGCTSLEEVNLPNFIGTVHTYSFYNCTSLKQLNMPKASYFNTQSLYKVAKNIQINVSDACDWYFSSTAASYDMPVYGDGITSLWCNITSTSAATFLLTEYDSTGSATGNTFSVSPSTTVTYGGYTFAPLGTTTSGKKTLRRTKISYNGPIIIPEEIEEQTEPDYSSMTQEELIAIINQQNERIEELENSGTEEE